MEWPMLVRLPERRYIDLMLGTIVSVAFIGQIHSPQNIDFTKKVIIDLGVNTQRRGLTKVQREWVKPLVFNKAKLGIKLAGKFPLLECQLESNIEKAGIAIESQGDRGTCTIFATKFLAEYELARQDKFKSGPRLNPEFLNWAANAATNTSGDGSSFPAVIEGLDVYGCSNWSEPKVYKGGLSDFDPNYMPSKTVLAKALPLQKKVGLYQLFTHPTAGLTANDMDTVIAFLKRGVPVAVGQQWPAQGAWKTSTINNLTVLEGTGAVSGAHTMPIVGYQKLSKAPGGGIFLFRNSWGEGWGYGGYHFMSFQWVKEHTYDACIAGPA